MKRVLLSISLFVLFMGNQHILAQQKVLTIDDYGQWSRIVGTQLSPDGNWTAFAYSSNDDNDTLYVKALNTDTIYEIPNASRAEFSNDNAWVSYTISPNKNEQKSQKSRTPEPNKAELLNLNTGDKLTVERSGKQAFSNNSQYWVVLRQKNRDDKSEHKGSDMIVHNLKTNTSLTVGYVTEFEFNKKSSQLAYLVDSENKFGNGLYLFDLSTGKTLALDTDTLTYKGLSWDDSSADKENWNNKGNNLAVLKGTKPKKKEFTENALVVAANLNKNASVTQLDADSMPDGSTETFTLQKPTAETPYWFRIVSEAPSAEHIYKDPSRTRQRGVSYYYPEFHLSYDHHRMFTTKLLAATNIALKTEWEEWLIQCVLRNEDAVKNYLAGMPVRDAVGDVVPSGSLELVLTGRLRESWQQVLAYYFYFVPGFNWLTWDDTVVTFDNTNEVFV